jgi:hypothetical protein
MREPGFYWVRFKRVIPALPEHPPEIAHWDVLRSEWVISGSEELEHEDAVEVLSERLQPPTPAGPECYQCQECGGGCVHCDGVVHFTPPSAKAAPKPAAPPGDRKRRPPPAR